ncbi:hypothetical protein [Pseudorhodoplanes sp.]|uniref:hypothetical protein n=1 Tax=Pseudorhodoplanes sp. TaxID=1934341 RepID=UPI003D13AD30
MADDDDSDTGDLIIGLNRIAAYVNLSHEGVRHLWAQGRVPVTKFGQFWIANRSALMKAMENETIRTRRGRKTDAERIEIQAVRAEVQPQILNSEIGGKLADNRARDLKPKAKSKLPSKPPTKAKAKPKKV